MFAVPKVESLEQVWMRKTIRRHVLEFALLFAIIFFLISGFIIWRYGFTSTALVLCGLGLVLTPMGYTAPGLLTPIWRGWMVFAGYLGVFTNTIILSLAWALVVVPLALLLRIIGKKVMDMTYDPAIPSYWETREEKYHDFKLLERQF